MQAYVIPKLGSGLGNRLFQYAAALGLSETLNIPVAFSYEYCGESPHGDTTTIFRMYPGTKQLQHRIGPVIICKEPPNSFYEFQELGDEFPADTHIIVNGFRQSPRYFPENISLLEPMWDIAIGSFIMASIEDKAGLATERQRRNTVSIHVRLGDYKNLPHHQEDLALYYTRALSRLTAGSRLHLFSDEPELCKGMFEQYAADRRLTFTIAQKRSDVESLYEMSLCRGGNIVANSTFSWWGAWFAHRSGSPWATYPSKWGQGMPNPTDLFPPWATIIDTT